MSKIFFVLSIFMFSIPVYAQEPTITNLKKGDKAPEDGALLNSKALSKILVEKEMSKRRCEVEKQYEVAKESAKYQKDLNNAKIDYQVLSKKYEISDKLKSEELNRVLKETKENNKNDYSKWWYIGGIITGVAATVLVLYATTEIKNINGQ